MKRFVVVEYVTGSEHPYMPNQQLFAVYDIIKKTRSMGTSTNRANMQQIVNRKNKTEKIPIKWLTKPKKSV